MMARAKQSYPVCLFHLSRQDVIRSRASAVGRCSMMMFVGYICFRTGKKDRTINADAGKLSPADDVILNYHRQITISSHPRNLGLWNCQIHVEDSFVKGLPLALQVCP